MQRPPRELSCYARTSNKVYAEFFGLIHIWTAFLLPPCDRAWRSLFVTERGIDMPALLHHFVVVGNPAAFQVLKPPAIERTFL